MLRATTEDPKNQMRNVYSCISRNDACVKGSQITLKYSLILLSTASDKQNVQEEIFSCSKGKKSVTAIM